MTNTGSIEASRHRTPSTRHLLPQETGQRAIQVQHGNLRSRKHQSRSENTSKVLGVFRHDRSVFCGYDRHDRVTTAQCSLCRASRQTAETSCLPRVLISLRKTVSPDAETTRIVKVAFRASSSLTPITSRSLPSRRIDVARRHANRKDPRLVGRFGGFVGVGLRLPPEVDKAGTQDPVARCQSMDTVPADIRIRSHRLDHPFVGRAVNRLLVQAEFFKVRIEIIETTFLEYALLVFRQAMMVAVGGCQRIAVVAGIARCYRPDSASCRSRVRRQRTSGRERRSARVLSHTSRSPSFSPQSSRWTENRRKPCADKRSRVSVNVVESNRFKLVGQIHTCPVSPTA